MLVKSKREETYNDGEKIKVKQIVEIEEYLNENVKITMKITGNPDQVLPLIKKELKMETPGDTCLASFKMSKKQTKLNEQLEGAKEGDIS